MLFIKVHEIENSTIVAMCDEALINKILENNDIFIDINTYSSFYKGELVKEDKALEIIYKLNINSANIIGKESINVALKANLIKKENIRFVNEIPYAQSFLIKS
ncbi:MAG: DUF424 family protein [Candidatus Micrarchaeia archaeon]